MKVGPPNQSPHPEYPTRREVIRQAGTLGLAALGLGALAGIAGAADPIQPPPPPVLGGVPPRPNRLAGVRPPVGDTPGDPAAHTYTVRKGDTLATIAKKHLGNEKRVQEIVKANPRLDTSKPLVAGQRIVLPVGPKAPDPGPPLPGKIKAPE